MRMIAFRFLLLLLAFVSTPGVQALHGQEMSDEEGEIRALEERLRLAVLHRDMEELEELLADDFMLNAPVNQIVPSREVALDLMRQGVIQYSSLEIRIEEVRVDDDLAVVMGAETAQPAGNAPTAGQTEERRYTNVWKKDDDGWRLAARHAHVVAP